MPSAIALRVGCWPTGQTDAQTRRERDDQRDPEPPGAEHDADRDRRGNRHPHPRPARRLQRDEPGDDRRDDRGLRLARRPGAAAGADRDRRRQGVLRRRRRHLVPQRGRVGGDRPALRRAARRRGPARGDRRPAADPLPGDRRAQRAGGRRRLLAGARLRHPHRLRAGLPRLRLRPHRRLPGRRHDLLPAPRRRPQPSAGTAARRPQPGRCGSARGGPGERGRRPGRADRRGPRPRPSSWPRKRRTT